MYHTKTYSIKYTYVRHSHFAGGGDLAGHALLGICMEPCGTLHIAYGMPQCPSRHHAVREHRQSARGMHGRLCLRLDRQSLEGRALTFEQLGLWKGAKPTTGPSQSMGCMTSVPRAANNHAGSGPLTNMPLQHSSQPVDVS